MITNRQGRVDFIIPGHPSTLIHSPYIGICGLTDNEIIEKAKASLKVLGTNITEEYEVSYIRKGREI